MTTQAPRGLRVMDRDIDSITLAWDPPPAEEVKGELTGYVIDFDLMGDSTFNTRQLPPTAQSFTDVRARPHAHRTPFPPLRALHTPTRPHAHTHTRVVTRPLSHTHPLSLSLPPPLGLSGVGQDVSVRQLRHHIGPFLTDFGAICSNLVCRYVLGANFNSFWNFANGI